jgi:FkbM family methyltransferase
MNTINPSSQSITFSKALDSFYVYTGDSTDRYVQATCRNSGHWDIELTQWMITNIQPGWTCLDVGANIFYFTEVMARTVGNLGSVLAFEPITRLCRSYETSRTFNEYSDAGKIEVFNIALSNKKDNLVLNIWEENIGGSGIVNQHQSGNHGQHGNFHTEEIFADRLDSIYNGKIDFIKMDVEGHERFVFEGFSEEAWKCPLLVVELGAGQPDEFLVELNDKYTMEFLNGEAATFERIKQHDVVNVLLRRK